MIKIRRAYPTDAGELARLSAQLGIHLLKENWQIILLFWIRMVITRCSQPKTTPTDWLVIVMYS